MALQMSSSGIPLGRLGTEQHEEQAEGRDPAQHQPHAAQADAELLLSALWLPQFPLAQGIEHSQSPTGGNTEPFPKAGCKWMLGAGRMSFTPSAQKYKIVVFLLTIPRLSPGWPKSTCSVC